MSEERLHILDVEPEALEQWFEQLGEKRFRARQVLVHVYQHHAGDCEAMTDLSKPTRAKLAERAGILTSTVARRSDSRDGTVKLLLAWPDGQTTECVLIPESRRMTVCLSTQVGCAVGCAFCASGVGGLVRQMPRGQIVEQWLQLARIAEGRISHVVFMGSGEPLANYQNTLGAVRTLNAEWGANIAARHLTISTIGLPEGIRRLAGEGVQVNLAISLHAADDDLRRRIVPWARRYPLEQIISAAEAYFARTHRQVTIEYCLLGGLNTSAEQARRLAAVARRVKAAVNLIPYNPTAAGADLHAAAPVEAQQFLKILRHEGVPATLRRRRGADIEAACGQLRAAPARI
jgi:23S rRNA (adenine2503-C2)-methyltransferase